MDQNKDQDKDKIQDTDPDNQPLFPIKHHKISKIGLHLFKERINKYIDQYILNQKTGNEDINLEILFTYVLDIFDKIRINYPPTFEYDEDHDFD
jgi:hypothetical protein